MSGRIPTYIPIMALVTAAYLTVEIPFSVRLVEVMGGDPSQADVDKLEGFGRMLTGVAVAIWVVGSFVLPRLHARGFGLFLSFILSAAIGATSVYGTYMALDAVTHSTGRGASGAERKEALVSGMARRHLAERGFGDVASSSVNDWNTFVAVLPEIAGADALVAATGLSVSALAEAEAARRVGSLPDMRKEVFGDGFLTVRSGYARYAEGSKAYLDARRGLADRAERAWNEFQAEVIKRYGKIPGRGWNHAAIVRAVKAKGIPVRDNWQIRDKRGFVVPYMQAVSKKIEAEYARSVESALGKGERLQAGMDLDGFASHAAIQKQIRARLGLRSSGAPIVPGMDDASFRREVYQPKLDEVRRTLADAVRADASQFEDGGEFASIGTDAVKSSRLPALAILLSIAGAALHIFKFSGYASQIAAAMAGLRQARGGMRHIWGAAATAAVFAAMVYSGNAVTGTSAFAGVKGQGAYETLLEGAISIQPAFSNAGRVLGEIGGWQAFAGSMPMPVRPAASSVSAAPTASKAADPVYANLEDGARIPLPYPAPRD